MLIWSGRVSRVLLVHRMSWKLSSVNILAKGLLYQLLVNEVTKLGCEV